MLFGIEPGRAQLGSWTTLGNGSEHTGYYPITVGNGTFTPGWTKTLPGGFESVLAYADTLYVKAGGSIVALNRADGEIRWKVTALVVSPITLADGRLYAVATIRYGLQALWCLDATTGAVVWAKYGVSVDGKSAPTVAGGKIYLGGGGTAVSCFDTATGALVWGAVTGVALKGTPAVANGLVYSKEHTGYPSTESDTIQAVDAVTGAQIWKKKYSPSYFRNGSQTVPVGSGKACVMTDGVLKMFDAATGAELWSKASSFYGDPAIAGNTVFAVTSAGLQAYAADTGAALQTYAPNSYGFSGDVMGQPLITDDVVFFPLSIYETKVCDRATGTVRQTLPTAGYLAYANGTLYSAEPDQFSGSFKGSLSTYTISTSAPDPAPTPLTRTPNPEPQANPAQTIAATTTPWIATQRVGDVAWFLFQNPNKLERYDLATGTWLEPIPLPQEVSVTAFTVAAEGVYISQGDLIARYALDGSTWVPVTRGALSGVRTMIAANGQLFLFDHLGGTEMSVDLSTSLFSAAASFGVFDDDFLEILPAPDGQNVVIRDGSYSEMNVHTLAADGTLPQTGYNYSNYVQGPLALNYTPDSKRILLGDGHVLSATDLSTLGATGQSYADLDFAGDLPVLLKDGQVILQNAAFAPLLTVAAPVGTAKLYLQGTNAVCFTPASDRGIAAVPVSLAPTLPAAIGVPYDPATLSYTPDDLQIGTKDTVYVLSRLHQAIFCWCVAERRYLPRLSLAAVPDGMGYSSDLDRLYLWYPGGRITYFFLGPQASPPQETEFVTVAEPITTPSVAGEWVTALTKSSLTKQYVYDRNGTLLPQGPDRYPESSTATAVWDASLRTIYDTNYLGLRARTFDANGILTKVQTIYSDTGYSYQAPLRISPDGASILTGDGRLLSVPANQPAGSLGTGIVDGAWLGSTLYTLRPRTLFGSQAPTDGELQRWDSNYQAVAHRPTIGLPLRLFACAEGLLEVSMIANQVQFTVHGEDLVQIHSDPGDHAAPVVGPVTKANPSRPLPTTDTPWVAAQTSGGVAYFLFASPAKIERYDMALRQWLTPISLPDGPGDLAVSSRGIFVTFGKTVSQFSLDGTSETALFQAGADLGAMVEAHRKLCVTTKVGGPMAAVDLVTGEVTSTSTVESAQHLFYSPSAKAIFSGTRYLAKTPIADDGTFGTFTSSNYSDDTVTPTAVFSSDTGEFLADDAGTILQADGLVNLGTVNRRVADIAFFDKAPVVLRDGRLMAYSAKFALVGWAPLVASASRIFTDGSTVFAFRPQSGRGVAEQAVPLRRLRRGAPPALLRGTFVDSFFSGQDAPITVRISLLSTNVFTGTVKLGAQPLVPVRGLFDETGKAKIHFRLAGKPATLELEMAEPDEGTLYGTLTWDQGFSNFQAVANAVFSRSHPSPDAGAYTFIVTPDSPEYEPEVPLMLASGRFVVSPLGQVAMRTTFLDGQVSLTAAAVTNSRTFDFNTMAATRRGGMFGSVDFSAQPDYIYGAAGVVYRAQAFSPLYPRGFKWGGVMAISPYDPKLPVLTGSPAKAPAVTFGALSTTLVDGFRLETVLDAHNMINYRARRDDFLPPDLQPLTVRNFHVDQATGLITGTLVDYFGQAFPLYGAALQKYHFLAGSFRTRVEGGIFVVDPDYANKPGSYTEALDVLYEALDTAPITEAGP